MWGALILLFVFILNKSIDDPSSSSEQRTKQDFLPQHHAQFLHMDSGLTLQILSQHLALEVDFLQPVLKVHYTLQRREEQSR